MNFCRCRPSCLALVCVLMIAGGARAAAPASRPASRPATLPSRPATELDDPLFAAAKANDSAAAAKALDAGAWPNAGGRHERTPLYVAAEAGSVGVARLLIERGADVNDDSISGFGTALNVAIDRGHNSVAELLLSAGADGRRGRRFQVSSLIVAAGSGNLPMVKRFVEMGFDVHETDGCLGQPLHCAVSGGHVEVAEYLLRHGTGVEDGPSKGFVSPLIAAAACGNLEGVKFLIGRGADLNARSWKKMTALGYAKQRKSPAVVKFLEEHGATE
jgi:ankyrin repeat protein